MREHSQGKLAEKYRDNTKAIAALSDADYDNLLAENLVLLDLFDANANNAVVECMARATPVLINRLPAVMEYLGAEYPLYFDSLEEAAAKAQDFTLVQAAHQYLLTCPTRAKLSQESFLKVFRNSEVYRALAA